MPTIKRFSRCKLDMYSREHGVPHFHLIANGGDKAVFAIAMQTQLVGTIDPRDSRDALAWAAENRLFLLAKWEELNQ